MPERVKPEPLINGKMQLGGLGFEFTVEELRLMHRRMHVALRATVCSHYGENFEAQGYNARVIWKALLAVHKACINTKVPAHIILRVYEAARTSYEVSRSLGRPEAEARRRAVIAAQFPLEKHLDITPEYDYGQAAEDVFDGRLSGCWTGRREGNA